MKQNANEGISKVYWTIALTVLILMALGAVMWWYDGYILKY
nr:hypothetical protein [Alicyclobacillus tolerans]